MKQKIKEEVQGKTQLHNLHPENIVNLLRQQEDNRTGPVY